VQPTLVVKRFVEIGYIARAHGVQGQLRVNPHDPESTALERADLVRVGGIEYQVVACRPIHGGYLVRLEGLRDRERANALRGQPVEVLRAALHLEEGDLLLADLIGCSVVTSAGEALGEVTAIDVGPQPRMVVRDHSDERLIPVVDEFVVSIDLQAGRIVVDLPEGLPSTPIARLR
jgi:16S rRNA processing protein RimM